MKIRLSAASASLSEDIKLQWLVDGVTHRLKAIYQNEKVFLCYLQDRIFLLTSSLCFMLLSL